MMKFQPLIVLTVGILLLHVAPSCQDETAECTKLKQIARQASLRRISGFHMYCVANKACTGIDCNGDINLSTYHINTEFCFGFEIQNCLKPTSVDFYSYIPSIRNTWTQRVTKSERQEIPGATVNLGLIRVDPFANITLEDEADNKNIIFGVGLSLRMTYMDGSEHWPPNLQFHLIPPTRIPVAECKTPSATLAPPANKCIKQPKTTASSDSIPKTTRRAIVTTHGPYPSGSTTYGKQCNSQSLNSCSVNEICIKNKCQCAMHKKFLRGSCVGSSPIPFPTKHSVHPVVHVVTTGMPIDNTSLPGNNTGPIVSAVSDKNHKTIVIATCTSAGVLLLAGIAVTAFLIIRKKRTRYADHDILLQNDDDSEILT